MDTPALLPDGTPAELSVGSTCASAARSATCRATRTRLAALEQRSERGWTQGGAPTVGRRRRRSTRAATTGPRRMPMNLANYLYLSAILFTIGAPAC